MFSFYTCSVHVLDGSPRGVDSSSNPCHGDSSIWRRFCTLGALARKEMEGCSLVLPYFPSPSYRVN